MKKKRNELGQFTKDNFDLTIKFPDPIPLLRAIIIGFILLPWIYLLFYRLKILDFFEVWMEYIFSYVPNTEDMTEKGKKSNGFF